MSVGLKFRFKVQVHLGKTNSNSPSRPPEVGAVPMTHAAFARCIAIYMLCKRKTVDLFSPVAS